MKHALILILLTVLAFSSGCSDRYVSPVDTGKSSLNTENPSHYNWGLWQFIADPVNETLDMVQLRKGNMHLNVLPFLEPPPLVNMTLESVEFNGSLVEVDLGLKHPFGGLAKFTGFDVCGILITNGSITGFSDSSIRFAGDGDTRLLNPDGLSRWWNPHEFPQDGSITGYSDGLLGAPYSHAHYDSTLNGYKFFCDALTNPDAPVSSLDVESRCIFTPGEKNIRHYTIELGTAGLVFNYAIDACWAFPQGSPPWDIPDDFPEKANRAEAWNIVVAEDTNTLWNDGVDSGGELTLSIDVWDHYNAEMNTVWVESPGNFAACGPIASISSGPGYATYEVEITSATPAEDSIELLFSVESEISGYQGLLTGKTVTAYFLYPVEVDTEPVSCGLKNIALREGYDAMDIAIDHADGDLLVLYSDGIVYKYTEAGDYQDGSQLYMTYEPGMQFIDISPISVSVVAGDFSGADKMKVYADDGTLISTIDLATNLNACFARDVSGFTGHTYTNMAALFTSTCSQGTYTRWRFYPPPAYQTGYWYANLYNYCTTTHIHRDTTVGCEASDINNYYVYYLEGSVTDCSEYRVQRLYRVTDTEILNDTDWGPNSQGYWGGAQSDGMDGFWDPKDITRDMSNDYYILDQLSNGDPAIKKYTEDGFPIGEAFGDTTSISGDPLRIEGSDYNGADGNFIIVLHDGSPADMISIFMLSETPSE